VFEPVTIVLSIRVVPHDLGQAQSAEHGAHPLDASADRAGDFAGAKLVIFREQLNDCESHRVAEQPAETRLSIAFLVHTAHVSRFRNSGNMEMLGRKTWEKKVTGEAPG